MEYEPENAAAEWLQLRERWLELSPHPHVLDALEAGEGGKVLLRYAAFDWNHPLIRLDANRRASEMVAEWGEQVTDAFLAIVTGLPASELAMFSRPVVRID